MTAPQPATSSKWEDLKTRTLSALLMIVVGAFDIWLGGVWFLALIALVCGLMIWELVRMLEPEKVMLARALGALAVVSVAVAVMVPVLGDVLALAAPIVAGALLISTHRKVFVLYAPVIMLASYALVTARALEDGITWLVWLVLVVVITDIAGYFAGRMFGGPKFWPSISPKKTWSGTVAGWIGAGLLGLAFMSVTGVGPILVLVSMVTSFASQMGDIAESAIKRRVGVKDSSRLIPGHGGVLDRFDGLIGASLLVLIVLVISGQVPVQL
ncbi:MAG: phosphatidate cytidylyltransferase [Rhodobacterales bacterium]